MKKWIRVIAVAAATVFAVGGAAVGNWPIFWTGFMVIILANTEFVFERRPKGGTMPEPKGVSGDFTLSKGVEPVPIPGEPYVAEPHKPGDRPRDCGICASMKPRKGDA